MDKYAELRAALESGPKPGKWTWKRVGSFNTPGCAVFWPDTSKGGVHYRRLDSGGGMEQVDAEFIAACHPEAIRALLAERDALRAAQQWQPIETAPKDGSWIMAYRPPIEDVQMDTIVMVSWQPFEDEGSAWMWPDAPYDLTTEAGRTAALRLIEQGSLYWDESFTHWMPLPEAPRAALAQEQGGDDDVR